MVIFIGWLIVLLFEAVFIYLCAVDPSNWISILFAIVNGIFFIGMTNTLIHRNKREEETSSSSPISDNMKLSKITTNDEKQLDRTAKYEHVINIKVVGVTVDETGNFSLYSPRQKYIQQLKSGDQIILKHEPDNKYDKNAICVCNAEGKILGYIPKNSNVSILEELTKNNVEKAEVKAVVGGYGNDKAYGLDVSIFLKSATANLPKDNTSKPPPKSPRSFNAPSHFDYFDLPDPREYLEIDLPTREDFNVGNDFINFGSGDVDSDYGGNDFGGYDDFDPGDYDY